MKNKDKTIKEAQGRNSIAKGERNKAKVLNTLMKQPLTFSDLKSEVGLSSPVLSKHLLSLTEEGLIQKALSRNDEIVYRVISKKKAVNFLESIISAYFLYIFGNVLSAETFDSIRKDLEKIIDTDFEMPQEEIRKPLRVHSLLEKKNTDLLEGEETE